METGCLKFKWLLHTWLQLGSDKDMTPAVNCTAACTAAFFVIDDATIMLLVAAASTTNLQWV